MTHIISYQQNYDGIYTVVIDNVDLGDKATLLLDNGIDVAVDVDERLNNMLKGGKADE